MAAKLAILAGGGPLPARLALAAQGAGRAVAMVAFEGHTDPAAVAGLPHLWTRFGAVADIFAFLRHEGVNELVFAGPVRRPAFAEIMPDWQGAKILARLGARSLGDDGLLRSLTAILEEEGFRVIGIHHVLEDLLAPAGPLGAHRPDAAADADIARGLEVAHSLGRLDVGQAAVVQQGLVLGVEGIEGTDALLARCATLRRDGPGGVLVKLKKPQQDHRLDLPTIGVATVENAASAGLRGIAIEAGGTLVIDRSEVVAAADRLGLFVVGVRPDADTVIRVTGEELAAKDADLPSLRAAARSWYEANLRGRSVINADSGREIRFANAKKAFSTSADPDKLKMFPALARLVRGGTLGAKQMPLDKGKNITGYYQLTGTAELQSELMEMIVTIREDNLGYLYYNHNIAKGKTSPLKSSDTPHKAGTGSEENEAFRPASAPWGAKKTAPLATTPRNSETPHKAGTGSKAWHPISLAPSAGKLNPPPLTLFLIAGEPSGDVLGARLIAALKAQAGDRPLRFVGVGGPRMVAEGLETLFPMSDLALMGVFELLPKLPRLIGRLNQTVRAIRDIHPDAVITVDAPGFSFRVGKRLRASRHPVREVPLIHYVAPTVWAWRPERAKKIAAFLDHLLVILPFEPPWFEREGLACTFVGHSIIESGADTGDGDAFRARHRLGPEDRLIAVLPGSRTTELARLLPDFRATLERLAPTHPGLVAAVPAVPHLAERVRTAVKDWPVRTIVIEGDAEKYGAFAAAEAALAASGTVALELALARLPAVIAYRLHPLTVALYRRLIKTKYANLVNIMHDRMVVPELLQENCTPDKLAAALAILLDDPAARAAQIEALGAVDDWLGAGGPPPSARAAAAVWDIATRTGREPS